MTVPKNINRCRRLIENAINRFDMDLSGLVVLTEAASGYYMLTCLIAALGRADRVLAVTKDSRFGKSTDIVKSTMELAARWQVDSQIEIIQSRFDTNVSQADIVTNLGVVRPLDKTFLGQLKSGAVVSLMWETWEWRPEELDLVECRKRNIPVLGTNEHHHHLNTFDYIGHIALKQLFECHIEIFNSNILVLGSDEFARNTARTLSSGGAKVHLLEKEEALESKIAELDAIVVVEHHSRDILLGSPATLSFQEMYKLNPGLVLVHICGKINIEELEASNLKLTPESVAPIGFMSVATDYLGPKPLIDLHTAGLKVGEVLARKRSRGKHAFQIENEALNACEFAQGFDGYHHG